jgi:hypothetical protein
MRRAAVSRFFSRAAVTKLEDRIKFHTDKFCSQLETHAGTGQPVNLATAHSCLTTDIISEYAFARSTNFLNSPTFEPNFRAAIFAALRGGPTVKQWPPLLSLMESLPDSLVATMMPEMPVYLNWQNALRRQISQLRSGDAGPYEKRSESEESIFHELLRSDLPHQEKTDRRLAEEGQSLLGAGSEVCGGTSSVLVGNTIY